MKLKNVHYEYRGNNIWRIYFKDYAEADAFRNERTDGQKAQIAMLLPIFTNGKGVRYCVEAKLTGQFNALRRYAKDPTNDYFSNDIWRALVKKIEGADSDYIFDEIDLWYDATVDKCYFRICCMNGTWTDWACKSILNTRYGVDAGPSKRVAVTRYELGNYSGSIDYIELGPWNGCDITTVHFSSRTMFWIDNKPYRFYDAMKIFGNIGPHDILDVVPEYYEEPDTDELGIPCCKAIRITLKPSCVTVAAKVLEEIKPLSSDVGQGGLCVRRSCCGIGFGQHRDKYGQTEERIIFTVKNFCRGEADIVKVSPWTNTFIGTNKENEKEYSWNDFEKYMGLLSATGSDIWDIEWEYDETCPMTGTEVADKLHVYLKPLAYKRLFEEEEKEEPTQLLKNITDVLSRATRVLGCCTLYYYNLYFDDKSDLKYVHLNQINRSMLNSVKGAYYIRVVSYNKELPKNISSAALVWDEEEKRYSVEDFTIKGYRNEGKKVWISSFSSLWSNNDYLARLQALTPPPVPKWFKLDEDSKIGFRQKDVDEVPKWFKLDEDSKIGFRQKDVDEVQKEIDEMTKKIYEKLEIKQVKDFDTDTAWHEYLTATEMARSGADFDGDTVCKEFIAATLKAKNSTAEPHIVFNNKVMTLAEFNAFINDINNKEEKNMKIYWDESKPRIENVRDIVLSSYKYDRSVYYYRVYFESVVDAKNVMECNYLQDKGKHCWYYMLIASTAELSEEMKESIKTLYLTYDKNETSYYINWKAMYRIPLKIAEAQKSGKAESPKPTKILIQGTATIIWWSDGTKTIVKCQKGDKMDPEKGIAMCVMKKFMGTNETHSNYLDFAKDAIAEYEKQQAAEKAKKKAEADKKRRAAAKKKGADGNANYKRGAKAKTEAESKEES